MLKQISYERNKNKWYLCTRPNKLMSRKGMQRKPLSIWEQEVAERTAERIPILLAMDGVHIDNLIDKTTRDSYDDNSVLHIYCYAGLIVVKDLECKTREEARNKIDKNRKEYIKLCNEAIEKYKTEGRKNNESRF